MKQYPKVSTHTREYYSATKRREALILATIWMNLVNRMLSEKRQTQKDHSVCDSISVKCPEQGDRKCGFVVVRVGDRTHTRLWMWVGLPLGG